MNMSNDGLSLVKYFEGSKLTVYPDSNGFPTVGTGHLVKSEDNLQIGDTITQDQADAFLSADLVNAENRVVALFPNEMPQFQFDCLIDQAYNLHSFPTLAGHLLNDGQAVYLERTLLYDKDENGHTLLGLQRRRQAEVYLFQGQTWQQILPQIEAIV